jgi:hypothetical protein
VAEQHASPDMVATMALEALFTPEGESCVPSELTRGGWSDDSQHGSPPSGLLARAIELVPTAVPMQVVRFTIDLFRPVPLTPLTTQTIVRRDGKRIQVVDALLLDGDVAVGRATSLKIGVVDHLGLSEREEEPWIQPEGPDDAHPFVWTGTFGETQGLTRFHLHGVEIRTFGDSFQSFKPGVSWFRLTAPLVAGEEPTPFVRLATLADMSNGNSQALDPSRWLYVNPDITLYAHRMPMGEWVGMRSAAHQHDHGIGLADTRVFDGDGPIGRINQAQLLDRR